jgi:hypothetical protein
MALRHVAIPTAIHAQAHDHHQIVPTAHPFRTVTDQSAAMTVVHRVIAQPVVHMENATHVQVPVLRQIEENAVTVHAIHVQVLIVPIVHHVLTVIVQNVVTIVALQVIAQQVVHMGTEIPVHHHVQVPIVLRVIMVTDQSVAMIDAHQVIVHVAKTPTVAIAHVQVMIVMLVHRAMIAAVHATANAVADQIVPEVALPMIAKNVHAVALAKSA